MVEPEANESPTEESQLLSTSKHRGINPSTCYKFSADAAWFAFCALAASPTAFLNFIGQLKIETGELASLKDFAKEVNKHSGGAITLAVGSASCSETINTAINLVYLWPALRTTFRILPRTHHTFQFLIYKARGILFPNCSSSNNPPLGETLDIIDAVSFVWAFSNCLPFAQIARDELSFIGKALSYLPFTMNGLSYFATRFYGVEGVLRALFDRNLKEKEHILRTLLSIKPNPANPLVIQVDMQNPDVDHRLKKSLQEFLDIVTFEKEKNNFHDSIYFKSNNFQKNITRILTVIGIAGALTLSLCIWLLVIPNTIKGFNSLFHAHIGKDDDYHNFASLLPGALASAPTAFFYGRSIYNLGFELIKSLKDLYQDFQNSRYGQLILWGGLIIASIVMCYISGKGWQDVAETVINDGYLTYLDINSNNLVGQTLLPRAAAAAASLVNTSISTRFINEKHSHKDLSTISTINHETALHLIQNRKDFPGLKFFSNNEILQTANPQETRPENNKNMRSHYEML